MILLSTEPKIQDLRGTFILRRIIFRGLLTFLLVLGFSQLLPLEVFADVSSIEVMQETNGDPLLEQLDDPEHLRLLVIFLVIFGLLSLFGMLYVINTNKILKSNNRLILEQKNQISDQKDALAFQNESLEDQNIEKNNMLSVVAHDLKVPLGNIQGLIALVMLDKEKLTDGQKEYLELIRKVTVDGTNMVDNMLNVHKIEAELQKMTLAKHDIYQIVQNVAKLHQPAAEGRHIDIEIKCELEELIAETDKQYYHQIISNLLSNAIKFSPKGSVVQITIEETDHTASVSIHDEGPGMNPGDQKRMFTGYQKVSNANGEGDKSTGFGLAIVSKLIEKLKGKISVDSVQGKGTNISVEIRK